MRRSSGAAFMAVADAELRNKPTNASIAVHVADHDAVPLVPCRRWTSRRPPPTWPSSSSGSTRRPGAPARSFVVLPEDMLFDQTDAPALGRGGRGDQGAPGARRGGHVRSSLNYLTAWRRLDEMTAYAGAART